MNSLRPRTLTDYLRAARRRKFVIIVTAIIFAAAAFVAVKQLPSVYESSVSFIVEQPGSETAIDPARRLAALQQQISRARLESIISKYDLFKEAAESGARVEDLASQMRADIRITEQLGRDNQFRISYRAHDAQTAQKIANELAAQLAFDSAKAALSTSGEADQLRKRAVELSAGMRELEEKAPWLITLKDAAAASSPAQPSRNAQPSAEALRAQQMTIESLKDRQYLIQQQMADIERRIASERQIVEQQKKNSTLRDNPTYAVLIAKRTELQGQRDTLVNRQELTDKHPRVTAITDQINAINRQIEELRQQDANQVSQSPEARELMSLESERNRLKLELEINNREMARRASVASVQSTAPVTAGPRDLASTRLAGQYFGLKRDYQEVTARLDDAESKRAENSGAVQERIRLLGEAILPEQPVWPYRWFLTLAALVAGLALGACFAFAAESRRFASLQDGKDVDFYTRLPLLAEIPKTVTAAERKSALRQSRLRLAIGAVLAAVAAFALAEIFIITNLFTLIGKK
jgi:capsular polysaccharide biosynthesis protein